MFKRPIAIVVNYFPTVSETFIVSQINSLIDSGCQVTLFAYHKTYLAINHESLNKHLLLTKAHYFVEPPASKSQRLQALLKWTFKNFKNIKWKSFFHTLNVFAHGKDAYTLKLFFAAQWFLLPFDFDLIHSHFGMVGNRIAYLKAKGIIPESMKLITTFHGYDLSPDKLTSYKLRYQYLWQHADAFTVNTFYLKGLLKQINFNRIPIYILPVGLDTEYFKRESVKTDVDHFDIMFCGRLMILKAPDLAITIVGLLHEKGNKQVRLHIVGTGEMQVQLENQVMDLGLKDNVFFYGSKKQENVKEFFEKCDVFLLPGISEPQTGRAETQGLVIQEAQAMELPVIISDAGGMKYGILPEESGIVVRQGDLDGFVNAVERFIQSPELKINFGKLGRDFVVANYDNNILVEKLLLIYDRL